MMIAYAIGCEREQQLLRITVDKPSTISTGWLKPVLTVHRPPIKLVVYQRSYLVTQ